MTLTLTHEDYDEIIEIDLETTTNVFLEASHLIEWADLRLNDELRFLESALNDAEQALFDDARKNHATAMISRARRWAMLKVLNDTAKAAAAAMSKVSDMVGESWRETPQTGLGLYATCVLQLKGLQHVLDDPVIKEIRAEYDKRNTPVNVDDIPF